MDVEVGEVVVEERTEVRVGRDKGGLVKVEREVGKGKGTTVLIGVAEITELLLPETVEKEEPAGEPTKLAAEQSVVANRRWV